MKLKYPEITKEAIEELYINQNLRIPEIAAIFGCEKSTINRRIAKYNIRKPKELIQKNIEETNMGRYGGKAPMSSKEIKEKIKATNLERYGAENVGGLPQFQEKSRQTRKDRYGDRWESAEATQKRKETNLKIYGAENPITTETIKDKIKKTNVERYGVENPFILQEVQDRIRETNIEKYGTDVLMNVPEIREKVKQTNLKRRGVEWSTLDENMKEKTRETNLEKYGNACSLHGGMGEEKTKETARWKYYERWGVWRDNVALAQLILPPKALDVLSTKESFVNYVCSSGKNKIQEIAEDIGASTPTVGRYISNYGIEEYIDFYTSGIEKEIKEYIESLDVKVQKTREKIGGLEIDLYSEEYRVGIEVNGEYWHSDTFKRKNYHKGKVLQAEKEGIVLIHIYEYEWSNPKRRRIIKGVINRAFQKHEDGLSITDIRLMGGEETARFIQDYSLNYLSSPCGDEYVGVFSGDILLCIGIFRKGSSSGKHSQAWSLLEICYNPDSYCLNEESEMLDFFENNHKGEGVLNGYSIADKDSPHLFSRLGFSKIGSSRLNYVWVKNSKIYGAEDISDKKGRERNLYKIYLCGYTVWSKKI